MEIRRRDRAVTDPARIRGIVETARFLHLGLVDGGRPYVVPLHYGFELADGTLRLYLHSAREGRKLDVIARNPSCFVEIDCDETLDAEGDVPCRFGAYYASVMGEGTASVVEDPGEKARALRLLTLHQTGREFDFTEAMTRAVAIIRVDVPMDGVTAKERRLPA